MQLNYFLLCLITPLVLITGQAVHAAVHAVAPSATEQASSALSWEPVPLAHDDVVQPGRIPADAPIMVDGILDDAGWAGADAYDEFVVLEPDTLAKPPYGTRVRFIYSEKGLYVGIDMEQPQETLVERLSTRDQRAVNRDSINLTIDTSGEGRYGYWFGINLGNSVSDGVVSPERNFSNEWDGPWYGASVVTEKGWSAEFYIPWSTVSMPAADDRRRMGIYMSRKVAYLDERWGWPTLPRTEPRFMSDLQQIELQGVDLRQQYNVYPFASVSRNGIDDDVDSKLGADVFWRPSTNFQLNATLNPDFGGVESDDVVVNLTAQEVFFREQRLFFTEGQEVFIAHPRGDTSSGGVGRTGDPYTMLYTRRIGGASVGGDLAAGEEIPDPEAIRPVELYGAAKLTGQIGKLRYGALTALEKDIILDIDRNGVDSNIHRSGSDYGAFRLLYENRGDFGYRALGYLSTAVVHPSGNAFAQGVDFHWLSRNGKVKHDTQIITSNVAGEKVGIGGFADTTYTLRQGVTQRIGLEYFDDNIDINDLGFLVRNDRVRLRTSHTRRYSGMSWARDNEFDVRGFMQTNNAGDFTGGGLFASNRVVFNNFLRLTTRLNFQPEHIDDLNSFGNGLFRLEERLSTSAQLDTDSSKPVRLSVRFSYSEEDLGADTFRYRAGVEWRPSGAFFASLRVEYADRGGWLLHQGGRDFTTFQATQWQPVLRLEYFLSARHQFNVRFQWVGIKAREDEFFLIPGDKGDLIGAAKPPGDTDDFSISQMVFQARYRWEIAPLSELTFVYTRGASRSLRLRDDSFYDTFEDAWDRPVNNELILKLRYRFGS